MWYIREKIVTGQLGLMKDAICNSGVSTDITQCCEAK